MIVKTKNIEQYIKIACKNPYRVNIDGEKGFFCYYCPNAVPPISVDCYLCTICKRELCEDCSEIHKEERCFAEMISER